MSKAKGKITILENLAQVTEVAFDAFQKFSNDNIKLKDSFTVALSGGKTPVNFYQKLAQVKRSQLWCKSDFFLVDERMVPYNHEESNYGLLKRTFLDHRCLSSEKVHAVSVQDETIESSALKYEDELKRFFKLDEGALPQFDLIMLGLGSDGHTASLFPGISALKSGKRLAVGVKHPEDFDRVSLTLPVINNAKCVIFLINGKSKQEAVKAVLEDRDAKFPASLVNPNHGELYYLIDQEAAGLLKKG